MYYVLEDVYYRWDCDCVDLMEFQEIFVYFYCVLEMILKNE